MSKTDLFQAIQFSISTQISSIWPIERSLTCATILGGQSWPWSDSSEGVLHTLPSSSITETSPPDCLVSYEGHSLGWSYLSAEKQSVYFTAPAGCVNVWWYRIYQVDTQVTYYLTVHSTLFRKLIVTTFYQI